MSFLQPLILWALPLLALPIAIHLINQWRYQTKPWAPMMFLLQANRMNRGFARIRQWLILAMRTLAIIGLILAVSRPLSSGFWSLLGGGQTDTTLVMMDRSPSMNCQGLGGETKLATGKRQLGEALSTLGSAHWVAIDSTSAATSEFSSLPAMLDSSAFDSSSASAEIPQMLHSALDYLQVNKPGAAEIWICSDLQATDWNAESGDWALLRKGFATLPQSVRFHLLAFPELSQENLSIRVTDARRDEIADGSQIQSQLVLSLQLFSSVGGLASRMVPVQLELEGVRSELQVELSGGGGQLREHRVALPAKLESGWGKVTLPADANNADNEYYFVFDRSTANRVVIVADDPIVVRPLQIAASIAPEGESDSQVELIKPAQITSAALDGASLLIWQAELPDSSVAGALDHYLSAGGQIVFFPPTGLQTNQSQPSRQYRGVRWTGWQSHEQAPVMVANWRGDQDLLSATQSGAGLPVGQLKILGHATLSSDQPLTQLATLDGGDSLLARLPSTSGGIYFSAAGTGASQSSLAEEGVVLFVFIQRAIQQGQAALRGSQMRVAAAERGATGEGDPELADTSPVESSVRWQQVAGGEGLSTELNCHAGVYRHQDRLFAVNRPSSEDQQNLIADEKLAELFDGLRMDRIDQQAGRMGGILREIWRLLLILMIAALLLEAALCLPRKLVHAGANRPALELRG